MPSVPAVLAPWASKLPLWAQTLIGVGITIALGFVVYYGIRRAVSSLHKRKRINEPMSEMLMLFVRWVIIIAAALVVLQQIGVPVAGIWGALLAVGAMVAIGFVAVWSILSNVTAAMLLVIFRPFSLGDEIEVIEATGGSGLRGKVTAFNMFFTTIEESGEEGPTAVQVPNNIFLQKSVRRRHEGPGKTLGEEMFEETDKPAGQ